MDYEKIIAEKEEINILNNQKINELERTNKIQEEKIKSLLFELSQLKKLIFGSKREKHITESPVEQLNLFAPDEPTDQAPAQTEQITYHRQKKKKHQGRQVLPAHLPVEEVIIEPDGDTAGMRKISEHIVETVKYTPASLVILRHIYPKYEKIEEGGEPTILQAPARQRSLPKCLAENDLLAHIIISKFIDHLPFYRQIQRFERDYQWQLNKSTINDWFISVCTLLDPLYQAMVRKLLSSQYIQADESHIKVLDKDKKGSTHQGYQWVYHSPSDRIVIFHYRKGRGMHGPKEFLSNYRGYLQCDGYQVYDKLALQPDHKVRKITLAGCHVHARRYFVKAKEAGDLRADHILDIYQQIYQHEDACRESDMDERKEYRLQHIKPLFDEMKTWLDDQAITILPKSPLGKAIQYTLAQWPKLQTALEDGRLELDNNLIENKIRPLALGRKNYLFAGSHPAAQRIAMMYSFFATCRANDVNPYDWLKNTLDCIADHKVNELDTFIPRKGMSLPMSEQ